MTTTAQADRVNVPRVLIVDDRRDNLLALAAVLEPLDLAVVPAASGEEALGHLLDEEFAVAILDVQMPVIDGFETARLIKARERTRHLPIIFLTAISGDPEHFLEGYRTGAVDYVYKPFSPDLLRAKVSVFTELWRRGRMIAGQRQQLADRLTEVQRLNSALEQSNAALEQSNAALERSNAALEGFAALTASELREPLANIAGLLELAGSSELIDRARAAAGELQERVARLLDLARVGSVELRLEEVDLGGTVAAALTGLPLTDVRVGPLPTVTGDRAQLVRLFELLLHNCLRHAGPDAAVRISADGRTITVRDDGPGIDPGSFTLSGRGPGVGLAVCRRIVERHGGTIWLEPGPGTAIAFTLPGGP